MSNDREHTRQRAKENAIGAAVTVPRYFLAERAAKRINEGKSVIMDTAAIIGADIADGAILRQFNLDTPDRRILDGIVDHASQIRVFQEIGKKYPETRQYIGALAARAILVGGVNLIHLMKTGEVTKGQNWQRSSNLATAAFGLVASRGNAKMTRVAGVAAVGIATITGLAHLKDLGKKHPEGIRKI